MDSTGFHCINLHGSFLFTCLHVFEQRPSGDIAALNVDSQVLAESPKNCKHMSVMQEPQTPRSRSPRSRVQVLVFFTFFFKFSIPITAGSGERRLRHQFSHQTEGQWNFNMFWNLIATWTSLLHGQLTAERYCGFRVVSTAGLLETLRCINGAMILVSLIQVPNDERPQHRWQTAFGCSSGCAGVQPLLEGLWPFQGLIRKWS